MRYVAKKAAQLQFEIKHERIHDDKKKKQKKYLTLDTFFFTLLKLFLASFFPSLATEYT